MTTPEIVQWMNRVTESLRPVFDALAAGAAEFNRTSRFNHRHIMRRKIRRALRG